MHEVYVFCGEQGRKLEGQLLFCFELDVSALFVQAWDCHRENSREFHFGRRGGRHSRRHVSNKTMLLLYLASQSHKICDVYEVKASFRLVIGLASENVMFRS